MAEQDCGCTWDDNRDSALLKPEIIYCPMHAAAGDMLAALEKAAVQLGYCRITHDYMEACTCGHCSVQRECRQAVAAARGGAA